MSRLCGKVNKILKALNSGDCKKQSELFKATYNHLKLIAYEYTNDKNNTEDVLMEAYLKIFRYSRTANIQKDGYNWMCKIVQNTAYDVNNLYIEYDPLEEAREVSDDFESISLASMEKSDLMNVLKKLPKADWELIYLRFWRDYSYAKIAEIKNLSKSYIHKRISRILAFLLKKLLEESSDKSD